MSTLIGFELGVLLCISPIAITIGEFGLLTGGFKPPLHELFQVMSLNSSGPIKE